MKKWAIYGCCAIVVLLLGTAAFLFMQKDVQIEVNTSKAELPGSSIIPAERLVSWAVGDTVGVPGGIRTDRAKCVTNECVALENASESYKNGSTSASALIQAAINSAPASTYVLIPAGTFLINTTISLGHTRDNITLKGAGMDSTLLDCRGYRCITVGSESDWNWAYPSTNNTITAGLTKNSTQITIADTSPFSAGQIARIRVANDFTKPIYNVSGHNYSRSQMVRITGKTATTLSFYPPLYDTYTGESAMIRVAQQQGEFIGVEDMTLDGNNSSVTFGVWFQQTYGSWLKNVKVWRMANYNVYFASSLNCEARQNTIDELKRAGGAATPNGAGLLFEVNSGCLIEDNIIRESFPNIEVNHGASGNVFAYNFVNNASGLIGIDTNHGPHNQFNLYEGNVSHNLMSDGYFGTVSDDTVFRNWLTGKASGWCLSLKRLSRDYSIVGNQLGNLDAPGTCTSFGQPNIGNSSWSGEAQLSTGDYWKDYDPVTGTNIAGTVTARADNTHATITLSSGSVLVGQAISVWANGAAIASANVTAVSGNTIGIDSTPWSQSLPAVNAGVVIWPGPGGLQELDLDVEATSLKKGNWYSGANSVPAIEASNGVQLPDSLFRNSKPDYFGALTWPPFNPASPQLSYEAIPAGYRYVNNASVPVSPNPAPAPPQPQPAPNPPPSSGGGGGGSAKPNPLPNPPPATSGNRHPRGALVNINGTIYFIGAEIRYPFPSAEVFLSWGVSFQDVVPATSGDIAMPIGPIVEMRTSATRHPRGTLVNINGTIYFLGTELRYPFPSAQVFLSWGVKFSDVVPANSGDLAMPVGSVVEMKK